MAYVITQPRLLYVMQIGDKKHQDLLKIGDIFVTEEEFREYSQADMLAELVSEKLKEKSWAKNLKFKIIFAAGTAYETFKGIKTFTSSDIIDILSNSGYNPEYLKKDADIWMPVGLEKVKTAIEAAKQGKKTIEGKPAPPPKPIRFRPEQKQAIEEAIKRFSTKTGKKFLWNAKMRFGKTLSALEMARQLGEKDEKNPDRPLVETVLIVTHRPVVDKGWKEDFDKIFFDKKNVYRYGSRNLEDQGSVGDYRSLIREVKQDGKRLVFFVSMQYLRLSNLVGGENDDPVKREIMNYDWDMVVVDEAHEGTQTQRGQNVIDKLRKENTRMLLLSGTPFNLVDTFKDEEIYTWDYVKEQTAKAKWEDEHYGDPNPYAELPHMNIFTFDLSKILKDNEDEFSEFKFNEFFRTWTGDLKKDGQEMPSEEYKGKFIHESAVNDFLNLLINANEGSNYPFSTDEFRKKFRHTFWIVPGVKEAKALENLLSQHPIFKKFKIVNVAGDGNIEDPDNSALHEVEDAIKKNKYTITLSCGKLTTGVSVPQWTAVLYMRGSELTTVSSYLQTIFRVQTHAVIGGEQKRECYVFDFAPSRALKAVAETAKYAVRAKGSGGMHLVKGSQEEEEKELGEFLKFCPVISLDSGAMVKYEASKLFAQLKDVYVARAVQSGYGDNSLYSATTLMDLGEEALKALDKIKNKIGTMANLPKPENINIGAKDLTPEEKEKLKKAKKKKKRERTPEQQALIDKQNEINKEKKARISVLRGISIRIPLLVYGAEMQDNEEDAKLSIENFTTMVDDASWAEFMPAGVTKDDFNKIRKSYDPVVFREAAKRIRSLTRAADSMDVEERIERIATIFSYFLNPDKETVLTPWRVVNMHMADTLGGWCFYDKEYSAPNVEIREENGIDIEFRWPRWVDQGEVTEEVFKNKDARLLEINSKTGLYPLYLAYSLYREWKPEYQKHDLIEKAERDDKVIWDSILKENLFVVCKTPMARAITRRTLVGFRKHDDGSQIQVNAVCPEWYDKKSDRYLDLIEIFRINSKQFEQDVQKCDWWEKVDKKAKIKLEKNLFNEMINFNAIVGNPPYQGSARVQLYPSFYISSINIGRIVSLIFPTGWQRPCAPTAKGLFKLNNEEIKADKQIVFIDNKHGLFPDVSGAEEINVILWRKNYDNLLDGYQRMLSDGENEQKIKLEWVRDGNDKPDEIKELANIVKESEGFKSITDENWISAKNPFGVPTDLFDKPEKYDIGIPTKEPSSDNDYRVFGAIKHQRTIRFLPSSSKIKQPENLKGHKIFVPWAWGNMDEKAGLGGAYADIFLAKPMDICSMTYNTFGNFSNPDKAFRAGKYMMTKFFRALLYMNKDVKTSSRTAYSGIPFQNLEENWWDGSIEDIDRKLFEIYKIPKDIQDFINENIQTRSIENIIIQ